MSKHFGYLADVVGVACLILALVSVAGDNGWIPSPGPAPGPVDPVDPPQPPAPVVSPIPHDGLHVLIVEETSSRSRLTPEQVSIFTDTKWRDYVSSKNGKFRVLDQHAEFTDSSDIFKAALDRPRSGIPWLIVSNQPHGGEEIPLPANPAALLEVLKKWGDK
jgi:hypothetical protein